MGEENEAERFYGKVENIPSSLSSLNDPLPKAVLAAYMTRKTYLSNNSSVKVIYNQLDNASALIEESLAFSSCKKQNNLVLVSFYFLRILNLIFANE